MGIAKEARGKPTAAEKLGERARRMAEFLVADPNLSPRDAARMAGYSESFAKSSSYGMLHKPGFRAYTEILKNQQIDRTKIDPDLIVKSLVRIAEKAEQEGRYSDANRSLELLGKHFQMFKEISRHEHVNEKNPFSTGKSEVAKRADLHRVTRVTGLANKAKEEEEIPDGEPIH